MNVDPYEKFWMGMAAVIVAAFIGTIAYTARAYTLAPPSHVETIDPAQVMQDPRFANPGVTTLRDSAQQVVMVAMRYAWLPAEVHVIARRPVRFRLTSMDVVHGFEVAGTNANAMVVPGYVSQFTTTFDKPGTYLVACNEYCGVGHHTMQASIVVEEPR
jgi:cytochrome c oxidase subunit II